MRTTLDISDDLLADAKALAAQQRTTLTRLIEEGLQLRLRHGRRSRAQADVPVQLPVHHGAGGLATGLDPCSNRSLFDAADDDA